MQYINYTAHYFLKTPERPILTSDLLPLCLDGLDRDDEQLKHFSVVFCLPYTEAGSHVTDGGVAAVKQPFKKHGGGGGSLFTPSSPPPPGRQDTQKKEKSDTEERKSFAKNTSPRGRRPPAALIGFRLSGEEQPAWFPSGG